MSNSDQTLIVLDDGQSGRARIFEGPVEIIRCHSAGEANGALSRLGEAAASGRHAAGFMAYELGYALEPRLAPLMPAALPVPLLWFALFDRPPLVLEGESLASFLHRRMQAGHRLSGVRLLEGRRLYDAKFDRIRNYIATGDVYQINLTFPLEFECRGDPLSLWCALRARQPVAHGGFVRTAEFSLLSLSPELFVEAKNGRLTSRPMKGTAVREPGNDETVAERLYWDEKCRAENLMIVDLIRNDIARVTELGSVHVPELFTVETYPRFFGMTSTVTGRLRQGVTFPEIVKALFPCGSVTGAPKIRAQEIIRELESAPRGVYTGSMGYIAPDGDFNFNVAIRTAHVTPGGAGVMGIGSGIVWDSRCEAEYAECLLKAAFLTEEAESFRLIESLLWTPLGGFHLLSEHLERLRASAIHFGFPYGEEKVRRALELCAASLRPEPHKVRLLLDEEGGTEVTASSMPAPASEWTYVISPERVQSCDPFRRHKTTRRALYDTEHARLTRETGCDEVLFLNERGELAEGSRTTLFLRRGQALVTPPLNCGALDGVLRRVLLRAPDVELREEILYPDDLKQTDEVLLGNSVRGLIPARPLAAQEESLPAARQEY